MTEVYSFTYLSDGTQIFLDQPAADFSKRDDSGYQYCNVYDDEYLENQIGMLGISVSGSVGALWGFGEETEARKTLAQVMKGAFPFLKLPLTLQQYRSITSGYFPVVQLFSEGKVFYDEPNLAIHVPSGANPEDFFRSTVFQGGMNDNNTKKAVLAYGYIQGLNDSLGDYRFLSIEITKYLWPLSTARVTKAYRGLVEDGFLEPMGRNTSSGFPSFTKVTPGARRIIEETNKPSSAQAMPTNTPPEIAPPTASYITDHVAQKLATSARDRGFDVTKLQGVITELNDAYAHDKSHSAHALIRTLLNHIAPLFGHTTFEQVTNNHSWTHTDKKRVQQVQTLFRFDADESLHSPISRRNQSPDMHAVGLIRKTIGNILEEAAEQAS